MRNAQRFFTAFRLELRLICWTWQYGLLFILWAAFLIANNANFAYGSAATLLYGMTNAAVPLLSLVAMMLAAVSAGRSARSRFDKLEGAYPTGAEVVFGRWLAVLMALAAFLIVPTIIAALQGPLAAFVAALPVFLLETLTLFAFLTAVVYLVGVTMGIRRWLYPLFAVAWLGSVILGTLNTDIIPVALLGAFAAQGWINNAYTELWGRLTLGNIPLYFDLFYVMLAVFALGAVGWWVQRRRVYRPSFIMATITIIGLVGAIGAARLYSLDVVAAQKQVDDRTGTITQVNFSNHALPADMPYTVSAYDLTLDLFYIEQPRVVAQMQIVNRGNTPLESAVFTLHDTFTITDASLSIERNGFFITISLPEPLPPGDSMSFDMTYTGDVWLYSQSRIQGRHREVTNFAHPDGVNLQCTMVWYPVPGRVVVDRTAVFGEDGPERNYPDCLLDQPAQFTLTIQGDADLTFASNLPQTSENTFSSDSATWAHLMAAPGLVVEDVAGVRLVTADTLLDFAAPLVDDHYPPVLAHHAEFLPQIDGVTVFVTQNGFGDIFNQYATPITGEDAVVVVSPFGLSAFPENSYNEYLFNGKAMVNSVFGVNSNNFRSLTYTETLSYFLWVHYLTEGDTDAMQTMFTEGIPSGDVGRRVYYGPGGPLESYPLLPTLYDVYAYGGDDAIRALFAEIYAERDRLNALAPEDARAWIESTADDL